MCRVVCRVGCGSIYAPFRQSWFLASEVSRSKFWVMSPTRSKTSHLMGTCRAAEPTHRTTRTERNEGERLKLCAHVSQKWRPAAKK